MRLKRRPATVARSKGGKAATKGFVSFFQVSMVGTFA